MALGYGIGPASLPTNLSADDQILPRGVDGGVVDGVGVGDGPDRLLVLPRVPELDLVSSAQGGAQSSGPSLRLRCEL